MSFDRPYISLEELSRSIETHIIAIDYQRIFCCFSIFIHSLLIAILCHNLSEHCIVIKILFSKFNDFIQCKLLKIAMPDVMFQATNIDHHTSRPSDPVDFEIFTGELFLPFFTTNRTMLSQHRCFTALYQYLFPKLLCGVGK